MNPSNKPHVWAGLFIGAGSGLLVGGGALGIHHEMSAADTLLQPSVVGPVTPGEVPSHEAPPEESRQAHAAKSAGALVSSGFQVSSVRLGSSELRADF